MKYIVYLAFFILLIFSVSYSNPCLVLCERGTFPYHNPDSVMVDTCENSNTFDKLYARKTYVFNTYNYFFHPKPLLIGEKYTWENIDTVSSPRIFQKVGQWK